MAPSTPSDARALMASAVADPDPVLYYEHIALYRDPRIKQSLASDPASVPIGKAALRRAGSHLAIVSYGAYVHAALRVADVLALDGIEASVLDLRSLAPLDRDTILTVARHCNRVLVVHEDTRTGGIGESVAAIIQEEAFESLDAPIRILGALDTPVPYSPPLEEFFLPGEAEIERAARLLVRVLNRVGIRDSGSESRGSGTRDPQNPVISPKRIRLPPRPDTSPRAASRAGSRLYLSLSIPISMTWRNRTSPAFIRSNASFTWSRRISSISG